MIRLVNMRTIGVLGVVVPLVLVDVLTVSEVDCVDVVIVPTDSVMDNYGNIH